MREISLDRLRTLVVVADLGSFAEAARVLHLAPPTVSLHIADLESRVGAPLLSRKRGQVRASAIGETLVAYARQMLANAEQALEDVRRQVEGLGGRVRLGASTAAIANLLPQALERLAAGHPGIDVQIAVLTSQETLTRLADESLDVGIVALPQAPLRGLSIETWGCSRPLRSRSRSSSRVIWAPRSVGCIFCAAAARGACKGDPGSSRSTRIEQFEAQVNVSVGRVW